MNNLRGGKIVNMRIFLKKHLPSSMKDVFKSLQQSFLSRHESYSQCGEDLIVKYIFNNLGIYRPSYLDIGAHHPSYLNNTFIFYKAGSKGVNIEPDPQLFSRIKATRGRDKNLNVGVADKKEVLDFYVMTTSTLNTFSLEEAKKAESEKIKIDKIIQVSVIPINDVLNEYFTNIALDFLSLDVEGLDFKILQNFDFKNFRPKVICVETITYSDKRDGKKTKEIEILLIEKGYFVYADTHINTIFVDKAIW